MTNRYRKMCEIYKIFSREWNCDFSELALQEMYDFESKGIGDISISGFNVTGKRPNGFAVGKKWLNVQVSAWKKDFDNNECLGIMVKRELYSDRRYPKWWLDKIFDNNVDFVKNPN